MVLGRESGALEKRSSSVRGGGDLLQREPSLKRLGSKVLDKAGGGGLKKKAGGVVKHIGKKSYRFMYDVRFEHIDALKTTEEVVVIAERGGEVLATSPVKGTGDRIPVNEKVSREVTLYRGGEGEDFQEKFFKIAVRLGSKDGQTLGKTRLNFATYAEIPSGEHRLGCKLSNGASVVIRITSTFMAEGKKRGSGSTASSAASDVSFGTSMGSGELGVEFNIDEDLSLSNLGGTSVTMDGQKPLQWKLDKLLAQKSQLERENAKLKKELASGGGSNNTNRGGIRGFVPIKFSGNVNSKSAATEDVGGALAEENENLKAELVELENRMKREPKHAEMMEELRKAKASLAEISVEKEAVETELRSLHAQRRSRRRKKKYSLR